MTKKEYGEKLRAWRWSKGLTQGRVAEQFGTSRSTISRVERGVASPPVGIYLPNFSKPDFSLLERVEFIPGWEVISTVKSVSENGMPKSTAIIGEKTRSIPWGIPAVWWGAIEGVVLVTAMALALIAIVFVLGIYL